jgi:glycosyltransferase involved in cell wall biosynthesis
MPRVSIGLPVYNGENFLEPAIDSILAQCFTDFELIISDNASTDGTEEICREYAKKDARILYYRQEKNLGAIANYNDVFTRASGEYFKWAAHDDLIAPTFLARCVEVLDRQAGVVMCFPEISYIDERGKIIRRAQPNLGILAANPTERLRDFVRLQKKSNDIFWSIFGLLRRRALQDTALLDSYVASDRVLLVKLLLRGRFYQIPEPLFHRREHAQASTIKLPKLRQYRESAKWYNINSRARIVLPNWRLSVEYLSALWGSPLRLPAKTQGCYWVAQMSAMRWKNLVLELTSIPRQILGSG